MQALNKSTLLEAIKDSEEHLRRRGRHSDILGGMLSSLCDIIILKNGNKPDQLYDIKMNMLEQMIIAINRKLEIQEHPENWFNYLYYVARCTLNKGILKIRDEEVNFPEMTERYAEDNPLEAQICYNEMEEREHRKSRRDWIIKKALEKGINIKDYGF